MRRDRRRLYRGARGFERMRGVLFLLALVGLASGAAAAEPACERSVIVEDPEGDQAYAPFSLRPPLPEDPDAAPVDITLRRLDIVDDELVVTTTLRAAPPVGDATRTYRYWIGWEVARGTNEPEYIDLRISATADYDTAVLVGSNEQGNAAIGTYDLVWNGSTFAARVPIRSLEEAFGGPVTFGRPTAQSDGPHRAGTTFQWWPTAVPSLSDRAGDDQAWSPIGACPAEVLEATAAATPPKAVPSGGVAAVAVAFACACAFASRLGRLTP